MITLFQRIELNELPHSRDFDAWADMLMPCEIARCEDQVYIWRNVADFGWHVQHGCNQEHRTFLDDLAWRTTRFEPIAKVRTWLERIHGPSVFEQEAEPADAIR